ncbi:MAG: SDR family oxidoreductase [Mycobacteriales bacterium]
MRTAIVTGGAAGIGQADAAALTATGLRVAVVDRDEAAPPEGGLAIRADVGRSSECARAVAEAVEALGRLDVLVNCAGIQRYGDVIETPDDVWDEVIAVNLSAVFWMSKHAMPHLLEAGDAAVVNVASVQAFAAQHGVAAYSASKGGIVALTKAMAVDHAPRVRVNAICPGSVDTPMLRAAAAKFADDPQEAITAWGAMHPMNRVCTPQEVGDAVVFLAGPQSSFVTGTALLVDGGLLSQIGGT